MIFLLLGRDAEQEVKELGLVEANPRIKSNYKIKPKQNYKITTIHPSFKGEDYDIKK